MKNLLENFNFDIAKEKIEILFYYFFNNTMLSLVVFALSVLYIYFTEDNKRIKDLFVWYVLIILFFIWNPLFIHVVEEFINFAAMYRLYYMIPMYPVIAYSLTKIIKNIDDKWKKIVCLICICLVVVLFGKNVFYDLKLVKYNNWYKLPDETIFVANTIYNDKKYENYKKALVPYGMSSQIQQVHPTIQLVYTRFVSNITDPNGIPSPADTDDPGENEIVKNLNEGNTKYISDLCDELAINYVALYDSIELQVPLEVCGFEKIASELGVSVYRKNLFVEND